MSNTKEVREQASSAEKLDLIWNTTLVCPYDCPICCVDAVHVRKRGDSFEMRSNGLEQVERAPVQAGASIYDQAMRMRQREGLELSLEGKLQVLDHLQGFRPKIDFSGGDPLCVSDTVEVMRQAADRFGRDQVTLTATGAGLQRYPVETIAPLIGELNFTFDGQPDSEDPNRPSGYAAGNLRKATAFAEAGVATRAELPLTLQNCDEENLRAIYRHLHRAGVGKLLAMRLFPVGRGANRVQQIPTPALYSSALATLRQLEKEFGSPALRVQCALAGLGGDVGEVNPCDAIRESFGLMSDGTLLASPWAIGPTGRPLDDTWVLGNLAKESMQAILSSERVARLRARLDENAPHCKIFAWLHTDESVPAEERLFAAADPVYA